jgi:Zn finger protein HypA/HybF involved in hydrogenase expression
VHELSVALEICRIGEGEGELVVDNLNFCLETLLSSPPFEKAALSVERVPGNDLRVAWLEVDDGG